MRRNNKKLRLRLLAKKKPEYDKFFVFLQDDTAYEYDLKEWDVFLSEEWIEIEKMDGSEMDCFIIQSIVRVRYVHSTVKKTSMHEVVQLKPVPPNDAA